MFLCSEDYGPKFLSSATFGAVALGIAMSDGNDWRDPPKESDARALMALT